jgi:hypothetical protein
MAGGDRGALWAFRRHQFSEQKSKNEHQDQREHPPPPAAILFCRGGGQRILSAALGAKARVRAERRSATGTKGLHVVVPGKVPMCLKTGTPTGNRHGGIERRIWF